jgi:hypothetical protein
MIALEPELRLSEHYGGYRTDWYCDPPLPSQGFFVKDEYWYTDGHIAVRNIYRIELVEPVRHCVYGDLIVRVLSWPT